MSSDLSLLTIPEVPLKHILERCDYLSIQSLRKTCWSLRNFIDDTNLDVFIEEVNLEINPTKYLFYANFFPNQIHELEYSEGCKIKNGDKEYSVENENFQDVFWRDFKLFASQCSIMSLDIDANEDITEVNLPRIRTETLTVSCCPENLKNIITRLDEKSINSIFVYLKLNGIELEIDEIAKLEQWKNAEKVSIFNGFVNAKIDSFAHFSDVTVTFERFYLEDVKGIVEVFSCNPKMNCFRLYLQDYFRDEIDSDEIKKTLTDQFEQQPNSENVWVFEIKNSGNFLQMRLTFDGLIFVRLEKKAAV